MTRTHDAPDVPAGSTLSTSRPLLRIEKLSKTFGGTRALRDVELEIAPGEIHALVGQNGCGKSTLIKTLAGYHHADPGAAAWFDGEAFDLSAVTDARHDRLRFVHQDLGLVTELSALDNLALSRGYARTRLGSIDWSEQEQAARELIGRFGVDLDVHRPLMHATPVERTVVAIAAALEGWEGGRGLLVLDEPTAVLPSTEVSKLLEIVREVRRSGTSVLYVSHRLDEIFDIADRVTVLRGGRRVGTHSVADLTPQALASMMVGKDVDIALRPRTTNGHRRPLLEVRGLRAGALRGVDFDLHEGELLGVAGLPGSGRETLPYAIAGAWPGRVDGRMRLPGSGDWIEIAEGGAPRFPLVPATRTSEGVVAEFSVTENLTLPLLGRLRRRAALDRGRERALVDGWIDRLGIRTAGSGAAITTLSGGNQQKVVMARCLAENPAVLALCEPTAGVDVGTRVQLYDLIAEQARGGLGVLVSSSDEGDLLAMCTRVLVLRDGVIAREMTGDEITEPNLLAAMEGSH
jgi:ribose transport system ATP-binding protein